MKALESGWSPQYVKAQDKRSPSQKQDNSSYLQRKQRTPEQQQEGVKNKKTSQ